MILSDSEILAARARGEIVIDPFRPEFLGSNSYDVHLGKTLAVYRDCVRYNEGMEGPILSTLTWFPGVLDAKKNNPVIEFEIPEYGLVLQPGVLYLGVTEEYTETHRHVPFLEGKSSVGRLGISIHITAGKGDVNFRNFWTLEITVVHPTRIYAGMPIGQLIYHEVKGDVQTPYNAKPTAKYNGRNPKPMASQMHRNFNPETGLWN